LNFGRNRWQIVLAAKQLATIAKVFFVPA